MRSLRTSPAGMVWQGTFKEELYVPQEPYSCFDRSRASLVSSGSVRTVAVSLAERTVPELPGRAVHVCGRGNEQRQGRVHDEATQCQGVAGAGGRCGRHRYPADVSEVTALRDDHTGRRPALRLG